MQISLIPSLIDDSWILSAFNLLQCVVLAKVYEKNLVLHRYIVGKGKRILVAYSDNGGCSSLILHQNSTCVIFLKISCNVQSETELMNFLYLIYSWDNENRKGKS